jgi:glycerophosphoryl diester phosphodiesterase
MFDPNPTVLTILTPVGLMALTMIAGCSSMAPPPLQTLDGHKPLVIAHRGASGYLPEHTLEAYQRAIDLGADVIEPDLISTRDGVLIASHYPNLAINTDVASRPEFASRKRENWPIDGEMQSGWFAHDFTLAEIKTLGVVVTDPERPQQYNGKFKIVTLKDVIDLVKSESKRLGRSIAIYPETKNPTYHRDLALPLEDSSAPFILRVGTVKPLPSSCKALSLAA